MTRTKVQEFKDGHLELKWSNLTIKGIPAWRSCLTKAPTVVLQQNRIYECDNAVKGEYNSLQDAFMSNDIRPSTMRFLCLRHKELSSLKKDIGEAIIRSLNNKALFIDNRVSPAIAIWRMKQLGETEKQVIENTNTVLSYMMYKR